MKIIKIIVKLIIFLCAATLLRACPKCVGKVKPESPVFFSDDFYTPNQPISGPSKEQVGKAHFKKLLESKRSKQ